MLSKKSLSAAARVLTSLLVFFFEAVALADVTGSWSGTYTERDTCNGQPVSHTGMIQLAAQSGPEFTAVLMMEDVERNDQCQIVERSTFPLPASGRSSGTQVSLSVQGPWGSSSLSGVVSGNSMSLGAANFEATLTRTSAAAPETRLQGTYAGSHQSSFQVCEGPQTVAFSGAFTITLFQAGGNGAGFVSAANSKKDVCRYEGDPPQLVEARVIESGTETRYFAAEIAGDTVSAFILFNRNDDDHLEDEPFTASFNGASVIGGGAGFNFTASRSSASPAPVALEFRGESETIKPGSATTLRWDVFNATSVGIDNGIGIQPPKGSIVVKPLRTTTYVLTAFGPGGTVTMESTTVTVAGKGKRRRPVRR